MKIDLAGREKRGLAMGLNEFAGYFAVAGSAPAMGYVAAQVVGVSVEMRAPAECPY
jgi:hypothetical protein